MSNPLKSKSAIEDRNVQLVDSPQLGGAKKKYALRPMDRIDSVIGTELLNNPPGDDEHIYAGSMVNTFHDAKGNTKSFDKVQAVSTDGRSSVIGGWLRTSDPDEIKALDRYCAEFSGDYRKIYPIVTAE